jgi:hypothetical protein
MTNQPKTTIKTLTPERLQQTRSTTSTSDNPVREEARETIAAVLLNAVRRKRK